MESQNGLNKEILITTTKIQEEFPELTKYLDEMPVPCSDMTVSGINPKNLTEYYDTLNELLNSYAKVH